MWPWLTHLLPCVFAALKGLGKTVRLVLLPHEAHGYRARESVLQHGELITAIELP